jgi:hypothetical protein
MDDTRTANIERQAAAVRRILISKDHVSLSEFRTLVRASKALRKETGIGHWGIGQCRVSSRAKKAGPVTLLETEPRPTTALPEVETLHYPSAEYFDADAPVRLANGWTILQSSDPATGRITLTRLVTFAPAALACRKGAGVITVTWTR